MEESNTIFSIVFWSSYDQGFFFPVSWNIFVISCEGHFFFPFWICEKWKGCGHRLGEVGVSYFDVTLLLLLSDTHRFPVFTWAGEFRRSRAGLSLGIKSKQSHCNVFSPVIAVLSRWHSILVCNPSAIKRCCCTDLNRNEWRSWENCQHTRRFRSQVKRLQLRLWFRFISGSDVILTTSACPNTMLYLTPLQFVAIGLTVHLQINGVFSVYCKPICCWNYVGALSGILIAPHFIDSLDRVVIYMHVLKGKVGDSLSPLIYGDSLVHLREEIHNVRVVEISNIWRCLKLGCNIGDHGVVFC